MTDDALIAQVATFIDRTASGVRDDDARDALLADISALQATRVTAYAKFLNSEARRPRGLLPALPTDVFRFTRVASHEPQQDQRVFRTSGTTSGARGSHPLRSLELYDRAARAAARYALFPDVTQMRLLVLAPSSHDAPDSSLSYMLSRFLEWFGAGASGHAFDAQTLDVHALRAALQRACDERVPIALLGTSFAFVHAEDALGDQRFALPQGSRIMQTGGFKGRSREIQPAQMLQLLAARFGVAQPLIVQEYGMTELSSQLYETTLRQAVLDLPQTPRSFWVPAWVRAEPIDPATLEPVAPGEQGVLRIDDLANALSVCALQTGDLSRQLEGGLSILGRAPGEVARGCSLAVEEWLALESHQAPR